MRTLTAIFALLITASLAIAQCPTCQPNETPAGQVTGYYVPVPKDDMVLNVAGNCGFCSVEILGRYQGIEALRGFSRGKGGCTSSSMSSWLRKYNIDFEIVHGHRAATELLQRYLAKGQPVAFTIPGHVVVANGWTKAADGREYIWVIDNSGRERAQIKGWPKAEFDRRFSGWALGLRPIFPLRPDRPNQPRPGPHVDPTPGVTIPPPPQPAAQPAPMPVAPDHLVELEKRLAALEQGLAAQSQTAVRVQDVAEKAASLAGGLVSKVNEELPRLKDAVGQAKDLGLLSAEKADRVNAALEKVAAIGGMVTEAREKIAEVRAEAQADGTQNRTVGLLGGGLGILGAVFGAFAAFRNRGTSKVLPIPENMQLPGNPIARAAANVPQIPGTIIDDIIRFAGQRVLSGLGQPTPATHPAQPNPPATPVPA
jgi:hypothetical protein